MDYYVSLNGNDLSPGTFAQPFRHVNYGVSVLQAGDTLNILGGVYVETVTVHKKQRIVIQSHKDQIAVIDGALPDFRTSTDTVWGPPDPDDVYKSLNTYPPGTDRGAFSDSAPYTRLITYSNMNDLRARNQAFGHLPDVGGPVGPTVLNPRYKRLPRRPWVYMGPGVYQDNQGFLYARLSHTNLGVPEIVDYDGPEDPRAVPLALWTAGPNASTILVEQSTSVTFRNLTVRYGGGRTVWIRDSDNTDLDHVVILAGPYGLQIGNDSSDTRVSNVRVDGGLPPWYFRSDKKDGYIIDTGEHNDLGADTFKQLIDCSATSRGTTISFCEFVNAHDLQLNGDTVEFSNNWVRNINDDAVFVGKNITTLLILNNVFEQCLMALSVATNSSAGRVFMHRNLIDLRRPTAGRRPHPDPTLIPSDIKIDIAVMRQGKLFKDGKADPEVNVSHNTVVVVDQEGLASHNLFRKYDGNPPRRAINNIFVAINHSPDLDLPVAYLPKPSVGLLTDGNCYFRIGRPATNLLAVEAYGANGEQTFANLHAMQTSAYFIESTAVYLPGFEASGTDLNPRLRRYWLPLHFPLVEDLRLAEESPAHHGGISLVNILPEVNDNPPTEDPPDMGCYPYQSAPMSVGVDGLRLFPSNPLTPPPP